MLYNPFNGQPLAKRAPDCIPDTRPHIAAQSPVVRASINDYHHTPARPVERLYADNELMEFREFWEEMTDYDSGFHNFD